MCPDGYVLKGAVCESKAIYPVGYEFDIYYGKCRAVRPVCDSNSTLINGMCASTPVCSSGSNLSNNKCVRPANPFSCSVGGSFSTVNSCIDNCKGLFVFYSTNIFVDVNGFTTPIIRIGQNDIIEFVNLVTRNTPTCNCVCASGFTMEFSNAAV
jgi:hypothetical protein